jgi:hypothetical protein
MKKDAVMRAKTKRAPAKKTAGVDPFYMDTEWISEALHTALRKCCDSHPTSALWNFIYILPEKIWSEYVDVVAKGFIEDKPKNSEEIAESVKKSSVKRFDPHGGAREDRPTRRMENDWKYAHGRMTFDCIFRCFDMSDWGGYASFIERKDFGKGAKDAAEFATTPKKKRK